MSNFYGFNTESDINRVIKQTQSSEGNSGPNINTPQGRGGGIMAKVTEVVSAGSSVSGETEIKAIEVLIEELILAPLEDLNAGVLSYVDVPDPQIWDTNHANILTDLDVTRNLRLLKGSGTPAVDDIIFPFYIDSAIGEVSEGQWFFSFFGGSVGGAEESPYFRATFESENSGVLETWLVAEGTDGVEDVPTPRPAVVPAIQYTVEGRIINDAVDILTDPAPGPIDLINVGPAEAVEPVPPTVEVVVTNGQTLWFWIEITDAYLPAMTWEIKNSTTEPVLTAAPLGDVWKLLYKIEAVDEVYPLDTAAPRTGTKYTIIQLNEGAIDLRLVDFGVVRITSRVDQTNYKGDVFAGPELVAANIPSATNIDIVTIEDFLGVIPSDARPWAMKREVAGVIKYYINPNRFN